MEIYPLGQIISPYHEGTGFRLANKFCGSASSLDGSSQGQITHIEHPERAWCTMQIPLRENSEMITL